MWTHSGFHALPFGEPHELAGVLRNPTSSYAEYFRDVSRNGSAQYVVMRLHPNTGDAVVVEDYQSQQKEGARHECEGNRKCNHPAFS